MELKDNPGGIWTVLSRDSQAWLCPQIDVPIRV